MKRPPDRPRRRLARRLLAAGAGLAALPLCVPRLWPEQGGQRRTAEPSAAEERTERAPEAELQAAGRAEAEPAAGAPREPVPIGPVHQPAAAKSALPSVRTADLRLVLVDRATGLPVTGPVELWQLDLPADEHFTAGDRLHCSFQMPGAGTTLRGLPVGRYRAFLPGRRCLSEDPPELELTAGGAAASLAIDLPRATRYRVDLRDVDGRAIDGARLGQIFGRVRAGGAPFAEARKPLHQAGGSSSCSFACGSSSGPDPLVMRRWGGFDAGVHSQRTPSGGRRCLYRFQPEGLESVLFEAPDSAVWVDPAELAPGQALEERTVVAVALPLAFFDQAILLPDGSTAREHGADIKVECTPLPVEPDSPPDLWRACPIDVRASLKGYQTLRFTYRLGDGPPPESTLQPGNW